MARWAVLAAGSAAAIVGVAVAAEMLRLGAYDWAASIVGLSGIGAGVGTFQDVARRRGPWLVVLWVSTAGLLVTAMLAILTVGPFLMVAAMAAFAAATSQTLRPVGEEVG